MPSSFRDRLPLRSCLITARYALKRFGGSQRISASELLKAREDRNLRPRATASQLLGVPAQKRRRFVHSIASKPGRGGLGIVGSWPPRVLKPLINSCTIWPCALPIAHRQPQTAPRPFAGRRIISAFYRKVPLLRLVPAPPSTSRTTQLRSNPFGSAGAIELG